MTPGFRFLASVAVMVCAATGTLMPQQVFRASVDVVRVDALVTDRGKPVVGLTAADFELRDNGVVQRVELAVQSGAVHVVQVLDTSGSLYGPKLEHLKDAARAVARRLGPDDRMSLLTFSEQVALRAHAVRDPGMIHQAIEAMPEGGRTALHDAIYAGLSVATPDLGRSVLLVYSDGLENASWLSEWNIIEAVKRSEVVVYTVGVAPQGRLIAGASYKDRGGLLAQLADRSSGEYYLTSTARPLADIFGEVFAEFRSRYLLTYSPQGVKSDDGWHSVSVKLKNRPGRIKARTGYIATGSAR